MPMLVGVDSALIYRGQRSAAHTQELTPSIIEKDDKGISMPKPALFAVGYMESDWIRNAIQDERGRYSTGRGFSKDERKALAYADENVIARDMRRILKHGCKGLVRYRFVAPVMIDVYAECPIDQEEMAWFLSQKCFVSMDGLGTGVGPGELVVLPVVAWDSLRMMKDGSGRNPD